MSGHSAENDAPTCCACSGEAVARVHDGAFRKPVCATHRRLYGERGYLLDALLPTRPSPPEVTDAPLDDFQAATVEAFASMSPEQRRAAVVTPKKRVIPPGSGDDA